LGEEDPSPKEKFYVQNHLSDRKLDGDLVSNIARPSSSRGSNERAVEVQQRGPEPMALAKHQLHDHRVLVVFGESIEIEALSSKTASRLAALPDAML
jgi:hypothetical protein